MTKNDKRTFWKSPWVWIILIAVALLPRLIVLFSMTGNEAFEHPVMDSAVYDDWAWTIASGEYHGQAESYLEGSYYMGPLYAYFLTAVYTLFGHAMFLVRLLGILIGVGTVLLLWATARRLYGPKLAFFVGLVTALYPAFVLYDAAMLMSVLLVFLSSLMLYLVVRGQEKDRWYWWLGAGASMGLFALGRANILAFAPVLALWVFLALWKKPDEAGKGFKARLKQNWKKGLGRVVFLTAGVLVFVLPATIHNAVVGDELVLVTANGGINLFIGNNELATGEYVNPSFLDVKHDPGGKGYVEGEIGRELTYGEVSAWWSARAGEYVEKDPGGWLKLMATKLLLFGHRHEIMQVSNIHVILGWETPSVIFGLLFSLALLGIIWDKERRRLGAVWLFGLIYAISIVVFFITSRYRLPFVAAMIPPAVWGTTELWRRVKSGVAPALKAAALAVPILLVTNLPLSLFGIDIMDNDAAIYNNRGTIYYDRGTYNLAIEEFERAIRVQPEHPKIHSNLGLAYLSQGYPVAAALEFEEALRLYPNEPKALVNLGGVYLERYLDGEEEYSERALQYLTQAVTVVPGSTPAQINLAILRLSGEDYIGAAMVLEKALKFRPDNPDILFMLGHLFAKELNNPERAVPLLEHFLEIRPWTERHNVALDWLEYLSSLN